MIANVTHGSHWASRSVVVEVGRLRRKADSLLSTMRAFAEEAQQDVVGIGYRLQRDFLHDAPRSTMTQRIAQGTHALLGMRHGARVGGIIFFERKWLVDGPDIFLGRHRLVVAVNDAPFGNVLGGREREVQTTIADPEKVPVVAIGRVAR